MAGVRSLEEQKALLRKELRRKLRALGSEERSRRSQAILRRLLEHPEFVNAQSVLTYVALATEVETQDFLAESLKRGKKVHLPRTDPDKKRIWIIEIENLTQLIPGVYGILEPRLDPSRVRRPEEVDLAVVPGLAFDREGGRLGRGGGYFDQFLKKAHKAYKIGLAFEFQLLEKVPRGADDMAVDEVLVG